MSSVHLEGALLTSPPVSDDVLVMIATGWDWPTVMVTPVRVVEEYMLYKNTIAEYTEQKRKQNG